MTSAAISITASFAAGSHRGPTIREALAQGHVSELPRDLVAKHKAAVLREQRGDQVAKVQTAMLVWQFLNLASLVRLIDWAERRKGDIVGYVFFIHILLFIAACALVASGHGIGWLLFVPPMGMVGFLFFPRSLARATLFWQRQRVSNVYATVPEHLHARAFAMVSVPGVHLEVETLADDPLLYAVIDDGPFRQEACIGAWETGVPELDDA